jgi:hypothetical protein
MHGGLSLELCAVICHISPMALYRLICALGHQSLVTVPTRCGLPLPRMVKNLETGFSEALVCLLTSGLAPGTKKLHPVVHLCGCEARYQAQQTTHILPHRVLLLPSKDYAGMR